MCLTFILILTLTLTSVLTLTPPTTQSSNNSSFTPLLACEFLLLASTCSFLRALASGVFRTVILRSTAAHPSLDCRRPLSKSLGRPMFLRARPGS
ncbi:uncharacterized protein BDZ83DRAFT_271772 [Colletotrichum acutatum]|uniref:Secreted protein n=1 Tax=Glomerella acutata TaxID=27357 RepID=A0AAD8XG87_GLOAC|nr:uncharacterized protein BDZ83DRAFT_271772 [Colletotrichum acutatum]KAK1726102.1 hypothetical protein BDZ83DRAFT_271772 [Colletotrichum acutatum]